MQNIKITDSINENRYQNPSNRVIVHIGHYGSGKTELSLNYAFRYAQAGHNVTLLDLDIVNPYLRSGEHDNDLNKQGIKVIKPNFEGSNVDVPSLPADVVSAFIDKNSIIIIDAGGDPSGAAVLGRYHQAIEADDSHIKCVVNTCRPFTRNAKDIISMVRMLENRSKLKVDSIICNSNLARETTIKTIEDGYEIVNEAAQKLGLPLDEICVAQNIELSESFYNKHIKKITPIKLYMRPEWMDI